MHLKISEKYILQYRRGKSQGGFSLPNTPQPIAIEMEMQFGPKPAIEPIKSNWVYKKPPNIKKL